MIEDFLVQGQRTMNEVKGDQERWSTPNGSPFIRFVGREKEEVSRTASTTRTSRDDQGSSTSKRSYVAGISSLHLRIKIVYGWLSVHTILHLKYRAIIIMFEYIKCFISIAKLTGYQLLFLSQKIITFFSFLLFLRKCL